MVRGAHTRGHLKSAIRCTNVPQEAHKPRGTLSLDRRMMIGVLIVAALWVSAVPVGSVAAAAKDAEGRICRPRLGECAAIELGKGGIFGWTCSGGKVEGSGFYIVFVRPSGTYVLLKVPQGRTSFEFAPDTQGPWRWIVINTDPDGTRPDVESEPGYFEVLAPGSTRKKF